MKNTVSIRETAKETWEKISHFEIDDEGSAMTFTDRLARDNGWTMEFAVRTVEEYKKFIFLNCITTHPLTPSDQVDQAWHLHLLYTQSYWNDLCQQTIGRQIHHGPTKGGHTEQDKFTNWYEKTLDLYRNTFLEEPPADIWPPSAVRFTDVVFERVNKKKNWIIKKPKFLIKK